MMIQNTETFSYLSSSKDGTHNQDSKTQINRWKTLAVYAPCLTPHPGALLASQIASYLETPRTLKQREKCWQLIIPVISSLSLPTRSKIARVALKDVSVSPSCASVAEYLLENVLRSDISLAISFLPDVPSTPKNASLTLIIQSISKLRNNDEALPLALKLAQTVLSSPNLKQHAALLCPLLKALPFATNSIINVLDTPQPKLVMSFLLRVVDQAEVPELFQNFLTALLNRLSSQTPDVWLRSERSKFLHYISAVALLLRLAVNRSFIVSAPIIPVQKKIRRTEVTKNELEDTVFQRLFTILQNTLVCLSPPLVSKTLLVDVVVCIRCLLRVNLHAIEQGVPGLLDTLAATSATCSIDLKNEHEAILLDLLKLYSSSRSLPTLLTYFCIRLSTPSFQLWSEPLLFTSIFSFRLATAAANMHVDEVRNCLEVLVPSLQSASETEAHISLRLICLIVESAMKGSTIDVVKCILNTSSLTMLNIMNSRRKYIVWYFLSSLLLLASKARLVELASVLQVLQSSAVFKTVKSSKSCSLATGGRHDKKEGDVSTQIKSQLPKETNDFEFLTIIVSYTNEATSSASGPVEVPCCMRLVSVLFQIILNFSRNNGPTLHLASQLLKNIFDLYRREWMKPEAHLGNTKRCALWNGMSIDLTTSTLCAISGAVDYFEKDVVYDDVFRHLTQYMVRNSSSTDFRWEKLMSKRCFRIGASKGICDLIENLECRRDDCKDKCGTFEFLSEIERLLNFLDTKTKQKLLGKVTVVLKRVECKRGKDIICSLTSILVGNRDLDAPKKNSESEQTVDLRQVKSLQESQALVQKSLNRLRKCVSKTQSGSLENAINRLEADVERYVQSIQAVPNESSMMIPLEIANGIFRFKRQNTLSFENSCRIDKIMRLFINAISKICLSGSLGSENLRNDVLVELSKFSKTEGSKSTCELVLAAKVMTAKAISEAEISGDMRKVSEILENGNSEKAELLAKYTMQQMKAEISAGNAKNSDGSKVLALGCAVMSNGTILNLEDNIQLSFAKLALNIAQRSLVVRDDGVDLCSRVVLAVERIVGPLCLKRTGNRGKWIDTTMWRGLIVALGQVVEACFERRRKGMCDENLEREVQWSQRTAASLVRLGGALMQHGPSGGRWLIVEMWCGAIRYVGIVGGREGGDAVGRSLRIMEWCRQRGRVASELVARIVSVSSEVAGSDEVVAALGSLLATMTPDAVTIVLSRASSLANATLNLARQRHSDN